MLCLGGFFCFLGALSCWGVTGSPEMEHLRWCPSHDVLWGETVDAGIGVTPRSAGCLVFRLSWQRPHHRINCSLVICPSAPFSFPEKKLLMRDFTVLPPQGPLPRGNEGYGKHIFLLFRNMCWCPDVDLSLGITLFINPLGS